MRRTQLIKAWPAILVLMGISLVIVACAKEALSSMPYSDTYVRGAVVRLYNDKAQCTGVVVQSPARNNYILTAAHCAKFFADSPVLASLDDGTVEHPLLSAISTKSDLALYSTTFTQAIPIAKTLDYGDPIHALTHGGNAPTYRSNGEIIGPFVIATTTTANGEMPSVMLATTLPIVPGSSGGPLLTSTGRLIGIASCYRPSAGLSFFVSHLDIQEFMKDR